ncbi:uncharacterized protein [Arachis hypogaea]|uniref:uncharacterized protein isoform X1 n=1 Tax=Arachis hypogaea TaxID=3818 RepID=UPI000DEDED6B|nr:uncharacterized protein LOC112766095 isoform X1 [Arachis hypogaea]
MSDKKVKAFPKVEDDDLYEWVDDDVKIRASLFFDRESFEGLNMSKMVRPGFHIELLPCNRTDRIFHRSKGFENFYMYSCVLEELSVKLPFTKFECNLLTQMNCAPSQVHPNGWAFIKCFQILMEFLEIKPDLELFFSLFQAKGVWKGLWINLNSTPGFSVFKLYKSSFKDFKGMFFKVKPVDEEFPFYLDEHLGEKFPLYWCCQPNHILGPELITPRNECIISFLMEMVDRGGLVSVSDLLPWEEDKASVVQYLGGRFPGVSASSMRARFKMKNFEGSSSNAEKVEGEVEVNQPAQKKKGIVFKKRKSEVINLEEGEKAVPLSELSNFTVKQEKLHSFEEEGDGSSVWDKKFPFNVLADEIVQSAPDVARIEEVGDVGIDQFMQVLGFRLVSIGRSQEKRHKMMLGNSLEITELKEQLKSKEIVLTELKEELSVSKEKLKLVKEDHERAVESLGKKVNELSTMSDQIIEVTAKLKHMESNHEAEILDAFAEGFERAVIQAKFLHPEEDFTALDPSKVVRDGQLVDDEEVVEEEGNNNLAD